MQNLLKLVKIDPPPPEQRLSRSAEFAQPGERRSRYSMPVSLESHSPVGYRVRLPFNATQAAEAAHLLSLQRPTEFVSGGQVTEQELFEESALGVLSARQSTNFRGQRQYTLGPDKSKELAELLREMNADNVMDNVQYTHIVCSRPYRTPFTFLLTFIGHRFLSSLFTVPLRAWRKKQHFVDDIPTIGFLQKLHLGILADAMERATVLASGGKRLANVLMAPFLSQSTALKTNPSLKKMEKLIGLSAKDKRAGWAISLVAQVGTAATKVPIAVETCRLISANLLAFRSERIQPGVNAEKKAPEAYQKRQDMDVPEELAFMAGRAAYNAFCRWTDVDRETAKSLLLLERVDVLTENGKNRLREIREQLGSITDKLVKDLPLWADLPMGKALSRNAAKGRKAFALAGQRIYIGGLDKAAVEQHGLNFDLAVAAVGAAASRSGLLCELSGCLELPDDCDLLSGICLMAGPVNQNDIGKQFYQTPDLLQSAFPNQQPTSLLVWTLKAKTVADPIGNEEQLMNAKRKGGLVDLRAGPHEVVFVESNGAFKPMRWKDGQASKERAFADMGNFAKSRTGKEIPGNAGESWPEQESNRLLWP